jgi:hypothetical protein
MNQYEQTAIDRRKLLELGGKGLAATLGTGVAIGSLVGTSGCQTLEAFEPLNETRRVHYPRLAGHKIQSPEHYGLEGCMVGYWFGYHSDQGVWRRKLQNIGKPPSILIPPYRRTNIGSFHPDTLDDGAKPAAAMGAIPFITYECAKRVSGKGVGIQDEVLAGTYDDSIRSTAKLLRGFGEQHGGFFIRTMREMNHRPGVRSWTGYPSRFKKVWVHIWSIFEKEGANEYATWVWNPTLSRVNYSGQSVGQLDRYYPGDRYVDWIGMHCHDLSSQKHGPGELSTMFGRAYAYMRKSHPSKPIMIPETSTDKGSRKAQWVRDAFRSVKEDFPGLKALCWWSESWSDAHVRYFDGRIDSSPEALQAFKEGISDPYFLGKVPYRG